MNHRHLAFAAIAALTVQGCAVQPTASQMAADEMLEGQAKTCTASTPDLKASPAATITMTNDGWCGVYVADGSKPFALALIGTRPTHGQVYVRPVGSRTRVEYSPFGRYSGTDTFSVNLRSAGGGTDQPMQVAVTITPGVAPAVIEPETKPTRKPTPTRRTTTRRATPAR